MASAVASVEPTAVPTAISERRRIVIALTVTIAAFMEVLDATIINVALRHIAGSLGAGSDESTWVLTAYLVSNGIVLPLAGWLSGLIGRKRFFIGSVLAFCALSLACGLATSLPMLVVFRLVQGIAGGGLQPSQQAILVDTFPPERRAFAFTLAGIATIIAPILGPALGGVITDNMSWRWVFLINVPVGVGAAYLLYRLLPDKPPTRDPEARRIDMIGLGLAIVAFGCLQVVLDKGQQEDWFTSPFILFFAGLSISAFMVGIWWLLGQRRPIIDLFLFRDRNFAIGCVLNFAMGVTIFAGAVLLPAMLQRDFNYTATWSGFVLAPAAIMILMLMPATRTLMSALSPRILIPFGFALTGAGMYLSSFIDPNQSFTMFVLFRCAQALGVLFLMVPISTITFADIRPRDSDNAASLVALSRNLGGSVGISLVTAYADRLSQAHQSALAAHLAPGSFGYEALRELYGRTMTSDTVSAKLYAELLRQSSILAYLTIYQWLAVLLLMCLPLALALRKPRNIGAISGARH
ncbi:DHA2 family efflux MFS transporter permease subunit [Sandaracinobacteroides saxicola]|uniref:DHA2 family efflux MFS transporter permease subunit n=1 Tax=Sandaracinobacteroides saxicola TaxID=2759707 RepID=A0A7G5IE12_9SPHN|nr:DHA2 family efflux MFS transporter permease subunit [Sandaracinobacteroides saxicola]QMW21604.1 DHA2 family efflux MFS transporter permease subunit [Sandaracinobacteroides saxicola]